MNDRETKELLKLTLLVVAAFFAPVWIPLAILIIVPALLFLGGIISVIAICITSLLTIIFGIVGIPILFSMAVTGGVYLMYKAFEKIASKAHCILKRIYSGLKITGRIQGLMKFDLKQFVKGLPIIKRLVASQDDDLLCQQPLYEEESETETETVVSHTRRPSMHFPFPRASLLALDTSESDDEVEVFFNNVEEFYAVVCRLRRSARYRAASRRLRSRRNTVA